MPRNHRAALRHCQLWYCYSPQTLLGFVVARNQHAQYPHETLFVWLHLSYLRSFALFYLAFHFPAFDFSPPLSCPNFSLLRIPFTMSSRVYVQPAPRALLTKADLSALPASLPKADHAIDSPAARVYVGDCREILAGLMPSIKGKVDMVFADPPFNWNRAYDKWDDSMPTADYLTFTYAWLDLCLESLRPGGAFWVNIPDDWAAEIVVHMKLRRCHLINWCVWHYRFGQNLTERFINSKVHALYFLKPETLAPNGHRTWNPLEVLEMSDRAAIYNDARTQSKKDGMPPGLRIPMDVWYGPFWGRIQGNNKERRPGHDNQLPETYLERVVRSTSNPGDLVMDPFLGSGTTGVVAHHLKRRFIGVEYSSANAARAFERITTGPIRPLDGQLGVSTAIHAKRGPKAKSKVPGNVSSKAESKLLNKNPSKPRKKAATK